MLNSTPHTTNNIISDDTVHREFESNSLSSRIMFLSLFLKPSIQLENKQRTLTFLKSIQHGRGIYIAILQHQRPIPQVSSSSSLVNGDAIRRPVRHVSPHDLHIIISHYLNPHLALAQPQQRLQHREQTGPLTGPPRKTDKPSPHNASSPSLHNYFAQVAHVDHRHLLLQLHHLRLAHHRLDSRGNR